jgi:hypothetical protein
MPFTEVYTGANGTLVFNGGDGPEGQDAQAILDQPSYNIFEVGRVTDIEVHVESDLEEFHEIGRRHATSLHPGNIHIRGKVGRAYINGALLYLLLGRGALPNNTAEPYVQPALTLNVSLQNPAVPGNRLILDIFGVKFQNWSFALPEDDFIMEDVTFKALRINVRDHDGTNLQRPEFPEAS